MKTFRVQRQRSVLVKKNTMATFLQQTIKMIVFFLIAFPLATSLALAAHREPLPEELSLPLSDKQRDWLNQHEQIYIGAMDDWPPINFINHNGKADGFGVGLIKLLNRRLGDRIKLVSGDWTEIYQDVLDKKLDAILDITPKESREPFFNFTKSYLTIPHAIVGKDAPPYFLTAKELHGKTIALEKGFGNVNYYSKYYPEINIVEYKHTSEALDAVSRGDADAYIGNRAVANYIIQSELFSSLRVHARTEQAGSVLAIGAGKSTGELAGILQVALDSISSQELHAILGDVIANKTVLEDDTFRLTAEEKKWLNDHPVIRASSNPDWPPLEYYGQNGAYQGIAADFLAIIEKKLNIKFVHNNIKTWTGALESLESKETDLLPMMMDTPYRRQFSLFTTPYQFNCIAIVTNNSIDYIPGLEGLSGKKVAVVNNFATHEIISRDYPGIELLPYATTKEALQAVIRGDVYAFVGNLTSSTYIIQKNGYTNLKISGSTNLEFELSMGVRNDWPELKSILDKALATITAQQKAEIYSRWMRVKVQQTDIPWKWIVVLISILAMIIGLISTWNYQLKKRVNERTQLLEYRSLHDDLTQISNRVSLEKQLKQRIQENHRMKDSCFAVLFIDLDDFKKVNDSKGHTEGDKLLIAVANKLKSSIRKTDFIGRFGGDEFVIITERVRSNKDIETFCSHLMESIKEPYQLDGSTYHISKSIGVACYPADGLTAEDLLQKADMAMYTSKESGKNNFTFFSNSMNERVKRKLMLEEELRFALERDEIFLMYQPIVNLRDGMPSTFEALARWNSHSYGMISPLEFISLAEETGFIIPLGEFILEKAIASCAQLIELFNESYSISVNVSPIQLNEPGFTDQVMQLLHSYAVPAENLILEITEGVLINNYEQGVNVLMKLAKNGIRLSMDDFGTGYSSLSYIRNYPFNILKIDREFIQDISKDDKAKPWLQCLKAWVWELLQKAWKPKSRWLNWQRSAI